MTSTEHKRDQVIGFVGAGTVGTALATGLAEAGYCVAMVASRSPASAKELAERIPEAQVAPTASEVVRSTDVVFLTIPDDAIGGLADSLPWREGQTAVHCSGATGVETLSSATSAGALAGAFHPLQTFTAAGQTFTGVTFAIESESEPLRHILHRMATDLGGRGIDLPPGARALYHVSGVLASNYLVTLLAEAADLWAQFGYNRAEALDALLPLVRGTVENITRQGIPQALTGPIARGDRGTVATHLAALQERAPEALSLYREVARRTLRIAAEKGQTTSEGASGILALVQGEWVQGGPTE